MTHIVGDEIWHLGYRVAVLTDDVPSSAMGNFEDGINNATLFEDDARQWPSRDEQIDEATTESAQGIFNALKKLARGGLLNLKDVRKAMLSALPEGSELE